MSRSHLRAKALRVIRNLLDGTPDSEIHVAGRTISLTTTRLPEPEWPSVEGLDESEDGPWPAPLEIRAEWKGGAVVLVAKCEFRQWTHEKKGVGLRLLTPNQRLVWSSTEQTLGRAGNSHVAVVTANTSLWSKSTDRAPEEHFSRKLHSLVREAGLIRLSDSKVELFRVPPSGDEVLPSADDALTRLVRVGLLKLPFLAREGKLSPEQLPFTIDDVAGFEREDFDSEAEVRSSLTPLPGGVREYKRTLDEVLDWLHEPCAENAFIDRWSEQFGLKGAVAPKIYTGFLKSTGLVEVRGGMLSLSALGAEYREAKDPRFLFRVFQSRFSGVLEALVIVADRGPVAARLHHRLLCELLGVDWRSLNQTSFRRNWLLSLGLTEREPGGDVITEVGKQALESYPEEVLRIRTEWEESSDGSGALDDDEAEENLIDEAADQMLPDRVVLTPAEVAKYLGPLRLPPLVLEQACAALSCGKHLLLVGPPGTGKTELAAAIGRAAKALDYCEGLRPSTATSDWTTFETIGGYALEPEEGGSRLVFRPGVFLQALEANEWLLVDELNRADVDRAFGELMTVLAGREVVLPYTLKDERSVSVGAPGEDGEPETGWTHPIRPTFRLIATMNSWDKSSLFKLSYALQRRFAILHVDVPSDATYRELVRESALRAADAPPLPEADAARIANLFGRAEGILAQRRIGPAIALDLVRYVRRRVVDGATTGDACAEGIALFLLPQLEGLEPKASRQVRDTIERVLHDWAGTPALRHLRERWEDLLLDGPSAGGMST